MREPDELQSPGEKQDVSVDMGLTVQSSGDLVGVAPDTVDAKAGAVVGDGDADSGKLKDGVLEGHADENGGAWSPTPFGMAKVKVEGEPTYKSLAS